MLHRNWLTDVLDVTGTLLYSDSVTTVFEWDGPLIGSNHGIEYEKHNDELYAHSLYGNGINDVRFFPPKRTVSYYDKYGPEQKNTTVVENSHLKLVRLRASQNQTQRYFIPTERGYNHNTGVENGYLAVDSDDTVYYVKHDMNRTPDGETARSTHTHYLHPLQRSTVSPITLTNGSDVIGYGHEYEYTPLALVETRVTSNYI